jgi:hypothetical protein
MGLTSSSRWVWSNLGFKILGLKCHVWRRVLGWWQQGCGHDKLLKMGMLESVIRPLWFRPAWVWGQLGCGASLGAAVKLVTGGFRSVSMSIWWLSDGLQ